MSKKPIIKAINGMNDILPGQEAPYYLQSKNWLYVADIFREMTSLYGFEYIETPEVDVIDLYKRTSGDSSDIVRKEMYSWEQGDATFCLRPEGSASTCRAVIQSNIMKSSNNLKVWYRGGMFRHERPQFGRYRRHVQLGIEFFGESSAMADSEIIYFLTSFYRKCGLSGFKIHINSLGCASCKGVYREKLVSQIGPNIQKYCDDCNKRIELNPMRILDCKNEQCRQLNVDVITMRECLCNECTNHFEELLGYLDKMSVPYVVDSTLVRGLDYYSRTAFEVILNEAVGPIKTLSGGGRYDGLFDCIGGGEVPAVGCGVGIERLLLAMEKQGVVIASKNVPTVYIVYADASLKSEAYDMAIKLRTLGIKTLIEYEFKKLKKQMSIATSKGATVCIIFGEDEWNRGMVRFKNMDTSEQKDIEVSDVCKIIIEDIGIKL